MTYKQKIKFIKEYVEQYIKVKKWIYLDIKYRGHHGIAMLIDTVNKIIYINKHWLRGVNDYVVIKSVLLHEVGHLKTTSKSRKCWERELYAQVWACREAYRKKASVIYQNLVTELFLWGYPKYLKWNSSERKYILAHKMAIKKEIMKISINKNKELSLLLDYYKIL
jgi:hypothetical protein